MNNTQLPIASSDIEFNSDFAKAYDLLENSTRNLFITGKAGTGKSTLLRYFRDHTAKNVAVLAPTGVSAVNIKGQTVHSFFRFRPDITPEGVAALKIRKAQRALYQGLDTIIIDEISMVRADLLDCVDAFMRLYGKNRLAPFGGAQVVFFGDLYQLPPVVTGADRNIFKGLYKSPYFFDSNIYRELNGPDRTHPFRIEFIELKKIYRQNEESFIRLLGAIRNRTVTQEDIEALNERYHPAFVPPEDDFYIYLTTTNALADRVNEKKLGELNAKSYYYEGVMSGDFAPGNLPTKQSLEMKVGAQVMLLNNDPGGRWINGTLGKVIDIIDGEKMIGVELPGGRIVEVTPFQWEMYRFFYNEDTRRLESEPVGSFTQYPLRLAWAVTIHKSQGKTFDKVIIDVGNGTFAHGQTYVALSRCSKFSGLVLKRPILRRHIILDDHVEAFMSSREPSEEGLHADGKGLT